MKVRLASVFFAPVRAARSAYNGSYAMPAMEKGGSPVFLEITDMVQRWETSYAEGNGINKRGRVANIIYGEQIAHDLVNEWTALGLGMSPTVHPGIWMVRENIPEVGEDGNILVDAMGAMVWRPADEKQKRQMWEEDLAANTLANRLYAEYLITEQGDRHYNSDKRKRAWIPPNAKVAAQHFDVHREWLQDVVSSNTGPCPFCGTMVSLDAIKCKECKEIVNVHKYAQLMAEREAAVKLAKRQFDQLPTRRPTTGMGIKPATVQPPFETENEEEEETVTA